MWPTKVVAWITVLEFILNKNGPVSSRGQITRGHGHNVTDNFMRPTLHDFIFFFQMWPYSVNNWDLESNLSGNLLDVMIKMWYCLMKRTLIHRSFTLPGPTFSIGNEHSSSDQSLFSKCYEIPSYYQNWLHTIKIEDELNQVGKKKKTQDERSFD